MICHDRPEAGRRLAASLRDAIGREALVMGLAWGGVAVARAVADALVLPLDVMVVQRLYANDAQAQAIGAVASLGEPVLDGPALRHLALAPGYLEAVVHNRRHVARQQEAALRGLPMRRAIEGASVILVDQGAISGVTLEAAMRDLRAKGPAEIIVAVPFATERALEALKRQADHVVVLGRLAPGEPLDACYQDFEPVTSEDVHQLLLHQLA